MLGLLGYALVTAVLSILGARVHFEIQRHDLIYRSKKIRMEYLQSLNERMAGVVDDSVVIEDEDTDEPLEDAA